MKKGEFLLGGIHDGGIDREKVESVSEFRIMKKDSRPVTGN